jgi:hypothetical protein
MLTLLNLLQGQDTFLNAHNLIVCSIHNLTSENNGRKLSLLSMESRMSDCFALCTILLAKFIFWSVYVL